MDGSAGALRYERVLCGDEPLVFGLVGERLGHSHSPQIHDMLASVPYGLVEVPPDRAAAFFSSRRFRGVNVTIPYKRLAAQACDDLSPVARRLGNANTLVVRSDGSLYGDNTDYYGFCRELDATGVDVRGKVCLVLGDGGAAATVRAVLADRGAAETVTASRRGPLTFAALRDEGDPSALPHAREVRGRVSVVVNATPVGMYPHAAEDPPVDLARFPRLSCVCDVVYNPLQTRLVQDARALGVPAANGLLMLVAQARRSSDLFLGIERSEEVEGRVYAALASRLSNVSLIGMPGCGKSTVGRLAADELGWDFIDVDDLVCARAGMSVESVFAARGEEGFRALETACTAEALARPRRVVACGGGVVTRPCNLPLLRQNGPVVLLGRGLDPESANSLAVKGRPVSARRGVEALRREREPLYRAWADVELGAGAPPAEELARRVAAYVRSGVWSSLLR